MKIDLHPIPGHTYTQRQTLTRTKASTHTHSTAYVLHKLWNKLCLKLWSHLFPVWPFLSLCHNATNLFSNCSSLEFFFFSAPILGVLTENLLLWLVPVGGRKSSLPFTRHIIYSRPWVGLACLWSCCHSPSNSMSGGRTVGKQVGYQTEDTAFLLNPRNCQIEVWCISIIILGSKHISWSDKSFEETKEYFNWFLTWLLSNILNRAKCYTFFSFYCSPYLLHSSCNRGLHPPDREREKQYMCYLRKCTHSMAISRCLVWVNTLRIQPVAV